MKAASFLPLTISFFLLSVAAAEAANLRVVPGPFRSGKAYVDCAFDGVTESCFLDTGSAPTLVAGDFRKYPVLGTFSYKSASGTPANAQVIQIRSITLDRHNYPAVRVGRLSPGKSDESVLGMDILSRKAFALKFRDVTELEVAPPIPPLARSPLRVAAHGLLVVAAQTQDAASDALVDTGASITAVDAAFIREHPSSFASRDRYMKGVDGTGHALLLQLFRAKTLQVGTRTFRNVDVVATDLSLLRASLGPDLQIVIGFNLLRRTDWYFDPPGRQWSVR